MLLLMFRAADELYAVDAKCVVEVVPRVALRALPHAQGFVAGVFPYRGRVVPVIDVGLMLGGAGARPLLSTRIIVADVSARNQLSVHRLGLIAEQVSGVSRFEQEQKVAESMAWEQAPYLGAMFQAEDGLVQVINVDRILTDSLRDALFGDVMETS